LKEKSSGAKEWVQETGSQFSDKAHGNIQNNLTAKVFKEICIDIDLDAKEGLKERASGAKESVQETGSQLSDKFYGNYLYNSAFFF